MNIELLFIPPKSIVSIYRKITFVKIANLVYFNYLIKYSKVWDYKTQLIKI